MADFQDGSWCPDIAMESPRKWRLQIAKMGDGYEQRMLDGINALEREWKVSYSAKPRTQLMEMNDYLAAQKARAFMFTDPGTGESFRVFCDEWQLTWQFARPETGEHLGQFSATFRQANGVTA